MNIKQIVDDACEDYKIHYEPLDNIDEIKKQMCIEAEAFMLDTVAAFEFDAHDMYAMCAWSLYRILIERRYMEEGLIAEHGADIAECVKEIFSQDIESIRICLGDYTWRPEALERVYRDGYQIFLEAIRNVMESDDYKPVYDIDAALQRMQDAREELDAVEYRYGHKDDILKQYEEEVSEAQAEVDRINGNTETMSHRLQEWLNNNCVTPGFTGENTSDDPLLSVAERNGSGVNLLKEVENSIQAPLEPFGDMPSLIKPFKSEAKSDAESDNN